MCLQSSSRTEIHPTGREQDKIFFGLEGWFHSPSLSGFLWFSFVITRLLTTMLNHYGSLSYQKTVYWTGKMAAPVNSWNKSEVLTVQRTINRGGNGRLFVSLAVSLVAEGTRVYKSHWADRLLANTLDICLQLDNITDCLPIHKHICQNAAIIRTQHIRQWNKSTSSLLSEWTCGVDVF